MAWMEMLGQQLTPPRNSKFKQSKRDSCHALILTPTHETFHYYFWVSFWHNSDSCPDIRGGLLRIKRNQTAGWKFFSIRVFSDIKSILKYSKFEQISKLYSFLNLINNSNRNKTDVWIYSGPLTVVANVELRNCKKSSDYECVQQYAPIHADTMRISQPASIRVLVGVALRILQQWDLQYCLKHSSLVYTWPRNLMQITLHI